MFVPCGNSVFLVFKSSFHASNHFIAHPWASSMFSSVDSCNCIIVFSMFILLLDVLILFPCVFAVQTEADV